MTRKFPEGIRERSPGRWAIIVETRDPATGQRKPRWHSFKGTLRQAKDERARLIASLRGGHYVEPSKVTMAEFFETWLSDIQGRVAPRSHERYAEIARKNLVPLIGAKTLTTLRPADIAAAYTKALREGRRDGQGGLSPRTVHHMHRILKQALGAAVRWQMIVRNPADAVDPPKVERREMSTLDTAQTVDALEALRGTRLHIAVVLAVTCGLRRGEIAALRWGDVDMDRAQFSIARTAEQTKAGIRYKEPKSGKARTVAIPTSTVAELRAHRLRQAEELLRLGVRPDDRSFIVAQADGSPLQPNSITHEWTRLAAKIPGMPRLVFHELRHTHGTQLLLAGVHPKVASERLGHSKVGITLDLYSHVLPGMQEEAAAKVDAALDAALKARVSKNG